MAMLSYYEQDLKNLIGVAIEAGCGREDIKDMVDVIADEIEQAKETPDAPR